MLVIGQILYEDFYADFDGSYADLFDCASIDLASKSKDDTEEILIEKKIQT